MSTQTHNVLVIGSGGREHCLAWKLSQSPSVGKIYTAPGNAGTALLGENVAISAGDISALADFASDKQIDLTVVGPEDPLANGIVDEFEKRNLRVFGPTQAAAQLEASKVFAKKVMENANVPTGWYKEFTDADEAISFIKEKGAPIVVKADGLAAGKGVTVATSEQEAIDAVNTAMRQKAFGDAGNKIIVEEFLRGEEASIIALTDGKTIVPLASSQDHKAVYDGDKGPNTGGMGAYSPAPVITIEMDERIYKEILEPIVKSMNANGVKFKGVLYAGLIFTEQGPKVLEFNVRFGDPETQAILPRLNSDLYTALNAVVDENLHEVNLEWDQSPVCCVVMASGGYPGKYEKGKEIHGLENASDGVVFHAGTKLENERILTSGGRVLGVTAKGQDIGQAIENSYSVVKKINFENMYFRNDIGHRALKR
jgi:phosphoribosylamine--glycine ligase